MPKSVSTAMYAFIVSAGVLCMIAIVYSTSGEGSLFNIEGLLIVIGGSVINAFLSYQREDVIKAFDTIKNMLKEAPDHRKKLHRDIMRLITWSYVVQSQGLMELEKETSRQALDPLSRYGIDLVITGYNAEKIREMMHTVSEAEFERRCVPVTVLRNMAATAPAFGMVGTLVGMVSLFQHVGMDIANMGSGLAIAMLSTLYGLLAARLVCLPAADKLLRREEIERFRNYMLSEGFAMLAGKQNPFYMLDRLNSFMEPANHVDLSNYKQIVQKRRMAVAEAAEMAAA
jgi:chemotaxis protein MotA